MTLIEQYQFSQNTAFRRRLLVELNNRANIVYRQQQQIVEDAGSTADEIAAAQSAQARARTIAFQASNDQWLTRWAIYLITDAPADRDLTEDAALGTSVNAAWDELPGV